MAKSKTKFKLKVFLVCFIIVYAAALPGSIFTAQNTTSSWYTSIKPSITPPNFVFPIAWNILFILLVFSLYFAWTSKFKNKKSEKVSKNRIMLFFGINLFLNVLWSLLFFTLKLTTLAFFELTLLWISILSLIFIIWKIKKLSSYLLLPYALWVLFAGVLNGIIAFS